MATAQLGTLLRHIHHLATGRGEELRPDRQLLEDFAAHRDQVAFAALLARHGPMVLRVCRRVLHHEQDAEDAFQATFLVLAQNARAIRKCEALAAWLHGVAYRTAMKLRRTAARRRTHEAYLKGMARRGVPGPRWDDVQAVLDEEIQRLPPPLREVFILRVLEHKSGPEAAAALGIEAGTASSRLTRARQRLRRRLSRRGIELSAVLSALAAADSAAQAALPAALTGAAVRAGLPAAAGGTVPSHVAALAAGVTRALFLTRTKLATAVVLALALGLAGAGLFARRASADKAADVATVESPSGPHSGQSPGKEAADKPRPSAAAVAGVEGRVVFAGRVVSPEGQPVKGAGLYLLSPELKSPPVPLRTRSGADGTYRFTVFRAEFDRTHSPEPWKHTPAVALADGYGLGFPLLSADQMATDKLPPIDAITIQLARDDVPIAGRVLDLQGQPVAGARVRVRGIRWPSKGDLTAFIQALQTRREGALPQSQLLVGFPELSPDWDLDGLFPPALTDAGGRFRLRGIGRERVADLLIEGPAIETQYVYVMTRPGEMVAVPAYKNPGYSSPHQPLYTHYGATFDHVAAPSKPVIGVIRDTDTGKPIPGAVVEKSNALPMPEPRPIDNRVHFRAVTDKDGRYRITGLPRGKGNELRASPPAGQPFLMSAKEVPEEPGLEPVTVDFRLKRGVWIDVQVTDKITGRPVRCGVQYFLFDDNPHLKDAPGLVTNSYFQNRAASGTLRLVGLPGRGVVAALADEGRYLHGVGAAKIKGLLPARTPRTVPSLCFPEQFHTLAEVHLDTDAGPVACHLALDPGRTLTGVVVGPDGRPLAGARTKGLDGGGLWPAEPLKRAAFTVSGLQPGAPRRLLFLHRDKRLAGTLLVRGNEQGPLTAKLEPWGVLTGKLVPAKGKPADFRILTGGQTVLTPEGLKTPPLDAGSLPDPVQPDKDGSFRIEGLVPGLTYDLDILKGGYIARFVSPGAKGISVKSGEVRSLGDLQVKPPDD